MAVLAQDDFNRIDAATLGAFWVKSLATTNQFKIASNQTRVDAVNVHCGNYYLSGLFTWPDDQYSQAVVVTVTNNLTAVTVRMATVGSTRNWYIGGSYNAAGNFLLRISKFVNGTFTDLGAHATDILFGTQRLRLEAQGTNLRLYVDGLEKVAATDASHTTGMPGIHAIHNSTTVGIFDNWEGGALTPANKATVGPLIENIGVFDETTGHMISNLTFEVLISKSGAAHRTFVTVAVDEVDPQQTIRTNLITAIQAMALSQFDITLAATDIIAPNYAVGA